MSVTELWALILALPHETSGLISRMSVRSHTQYQGIQLFEGSLGPNPCILLQSGIGPQRAEKATQFLLQQYPVTHLLVTGYCGGLVEGMKNAEAILADPVMVPEKGHAPTFVSDPDLLRQAQQHLEKLKINYFQGPLVTVSKQVLKSQDKKNLAQKSRAIAVDMESYAVMAAAHSFPKKIAMLTVRFIVDALGDELTDTAPFIDESARVKPVAMVKEIIRRPKLLMELPDLEHKASRARTNLTKFVSSFFNLD